MVYRMLTSIVEELWLYYSIFYAQQKHLGCKKVQGQEEPVTKALISTKAKKSVNESAT